MANYLSLEEAAAKLGIQTDKLVELRSQGQVRGFRDGASWKFPENEIERLADELADLGGSGVLVTEGGTGSSAGSKVIGGDASEKEGSGSDLEIGGEPAGSGSDVNLVPSEGKGSDVAIVASDSDLAIESGSDNLLEIDSDDLKLGEKALAADSSKLDLAIEPKSGSTGPVSSEELQDSSLDASGSGGGDEGSDLGFSGLSIEEPDSGDEMIGGEEDSGMDALGSEIGSAAGSGAGASSLEMMGDLDEPAGSESRGEDVLSELDLLSAEQQGSGLISGDSENLLASSGLGSSIGADGFKDSELGGLDDALADDDELIIADDDDDLVISSAGSDISVAGDSGINLMSPSDSGLSLESEPLDLAGSSISALDLGAELSDGGSGSGGSDGSGPGSDGSLVDFQADEEFQLSPSGVGLDADIESGSQVIEVEDSEAVGEAVEFAEEAVEAEPLGGDVFAEGEPGEALALDEEGEAVAIDESVAPAVGPTLAGYEVPFTIMQCVTLMAILLIMGLGGMLMTDLVRNMWTYTEPSAPVSSLTDSLISMMGWGT